MSDWIRYEVEGGIATLTLARPEKRNAMTFDMLNAFNETVARAGSDPGARVLIVTGSGGSFCAGTDLADLSATPRDRRDGGGDRWTTSDAWALTACPKPVVAAIDGPAVGMGAELTSQCDVRLASHRAGSPFSQRRIKELVHAGLERDVPAHLAAHAEALRACFRSEDHREGVAAFLEKREANFTGR